MSRWVCYDDNGIIAEGDEVEVCDAYENTKDFRGDLVLAEIKAVKR